MRVQNNFGRILITTNSYSLFKLNKKYAFTQKQLLLFKSKMLKWAVNGSRQTYLQDENEKLSLSNTRQPRRRLKCKSLNIYDESTMMKSKTVWRGKENRCTSTPLHASNHIYIDSPSSKTGSLKDLSNILTESSEFVRKSPLTGKVNNKNMPTNYSSTLPTFDVEYSPCTLISGQILALRGVGVPDSYFGKPRYLSSQFHGKDLSQLGEEALEIKSICPNEKLKNPTLSSSNLIPLKEDSSLSSSKMGDITLEHMIDAILESTLKEKKLTKHSKHSQSHHQYHHQQQSQQQQQQQQQLSPTYTPGDDPASDLHEVWDSNELRYRQKEQKQINRFSRKRLFNETQSVNNSQQTAISPDNNITKLKRQRVVRRKRKIAQITDSIINSAHKLLGRSNPCLDTITINARVESSSNVAGVYESGIITNNETPTRKSRNISADSGHNSSNAEFEDDVSLNDLARLL
uniref:Uncharacterized protein n=1 Tax=Glossina brevipalpis TaxID=37001 RepID=A0A1A9WZE1_9MUSC